MSKGRRTVLGDPGARWIPWFVLAVGLSTTLFLYGTVSRSVSNSYDRRFKEGRGRLQDQLKVNVANESESLASTIALVHVDPTITEAAFQAFHNQIQTNTGVDKSLETFSGVIGVAPSAATLIGEAQVRGIASPQIVACEGKQIGALLWTANTKVGNLIAGPEVQSALLAAAAAEDPVLAPPVAFGNAKLWPLFQKMPDGGGPIQRVAFRLIPQGRLFKGIEDVVKATGTGLRVTALPNSGPVLFESTGVPFLNRTKDEPLPLGGLPLSAHFWTTKRLEVLQPTVIRPLVLPVGSTLSVFLFGLSLMLFRSQKASIRRERLQSLLAEAGRISTETSDETVLLSEVASKIASTLEAVCRIDLLDGNGKIGFTVTQGLPPDALAEATAFDLRWPRLDHDALLQRALSTGSTERAAEYPTSSEGYRRDLAKFAVGSGLVAPMMARGRAIGAITLARRKEQAPLEEDLESIAESVAVRTALAVDNLRLLQEVQEELDERRTAENEVRRLNAELEMRVSERTRDLEASNQELESFCYSVSHDLRTPLRSLDGFGRALSEDYGDVLDEQARDYIERIRAATKRMDELITALLTLSRLTRREILPAKVDVTALATDIANDLDPDGKVKLEVEPNLEVTADPRMLSVLFDNLLSNAIKFSSRTGEPKVIVGRNGDGEIFVKDNGAGFDPQYGNKLFQPFERLHSVREFPGHGIGLATVDRIVRRHGGTVRAEGRLNEGATFYFKLPD